MNAITVKKRLANLVRRFTQGRRRCGGILEGGGGLSFRDADVVPFTFYLDFPEGLSCRESTVDENSGKTVPYRTWKWRILERVRGGRRRYENWYGKREGGATQRFSCQQHYGPSNKKAVLRVIKVKELRRRSLNSHFHHFHDIVRKKRK